MKTSAPPHCMVLINLSRALKENQQSTFDSDHLKQLYQQLTRGVGPTTDQPDDWRISGQQVDVLNKASRTAALKIMSTTDKTEIAGNVADIVAMLNALKPFKNYNAVVAMLYGHNLARTAGYNITWDMVKLTDLRNAMQLSTTGDINSLKMIIQENLQLMLSMKNGVSLSELTDDQLGQRADAFRDRQPSSNHGESSHIPTV